MNSSKDEDDQSYFKLTAIPSDRFLSRRHTKWIGNTLVYYKITRGFIPFSLVHKNLVLAVYSTLPLAGYWGWLPRTLPTLTSGLNRELGDILVIDNHGWLYYGFQAAAVGYGPRPQYAAYKS